MATRTLVLIAFLALSLTGLVQPAQAQQAAPPPRPAPQGTDRVNVDRLPLDLAKLERGLRKTGEQENWDGFRLRYMVDVYGRAPRLQFFDPQDVAPSAPIPYGAPTHQEMLEVMTPKEYRAPVMDFSALMRWIQQKTNK